MSIVTQIMNKRPRFTQYLVASGALKSSPLSVIDVGARGGFEKHWDLYQDQARLIGFELDQKECIRLNEKEGGSNRKYYPIALDKKKGKRMFNVQPHLASSSFYKSDWKVLQRFPASVGMMPNSRVTVPTIGLDQFLKENKVKELDFLKLDVEGGELDVFKGAPKALKDSILGVSAEAAFWRWREKMPLFTDIDMVLRKNGFVLFDLPILKWERTSLSPYMFEDKGVFGPTDRGQAVWTQAVYFKDAVSQMRESAAKRKWWTKERILKLASLFEMFNFEDAAIELIQEAVVMKKISQKEATKFIDLLTPSLDGKDVTYAQFTDHIKRQGPPRYIEGRRVSLAEFEAYKAKKKK